MSIEAQPQAHNLFSFQIDWIKDKLDEIDANESPLAPQTEGGFSIAFYSVKTETQQKIFTYLALNVRDWKLM